MSNPVMSPDGKYMWSGSEWIPSPPSDALDSKPSILMQDSVVSGGINFTQNIGPNASELITSMLNELDKFDTSQSGFHIPDGGFSATTVINAINPIKSDITILQNFSTEHLLEFCTILETIGYSEIGLDAANIILGRANSSQNKELMAQAHILKSEVLEGVIRCKDSLSHAIEAAIISKELGNKTLESEALSLVVTKLQSAKKDTSNYAKRVDELLSDTSQLDHSSYAYLLNAKAQVIEYTDPTHSEELEQQALKYAKDAGDVRLQLYIHLNMINNEVIIPTNSDTDELRRLCAINGMKAYTALLDMIPFLAGFEKFDSLEPLSNKMKQISKELELPYYGFVGEVLFVFTNLLKAHNTCMETGETNVLESTLNDERVANLFQKCVEQEIYEFDELLLPALLSIRSTVYLVSQVPNIDINIHPSVKSYTMVGRDNLIADDNKFMFKVLKLLDRSVPIEQLTHLCLPSKNDTDTITECKELILHNIDWSKEGLMPLGFWNIPGKLKRLKESFFGAIASSEQELESNLDPVTEEIIEASQLDIAQSYNSGEDRESIKGLFILVWGIILCIAPFVVLEMSGGMIIWWGLWIWGGIEILRGLFMIFSD
jgi:hypothetical protein